MNIGQKNTISPFWNAVIASFIMVTTAILLKENSSRETIIIFQGILFGVKTGADMLKNYQVTKVDDKQAGVGYKS
jgi:hypothetical protein